MKTQRRFQPLVVDRLEDRITLSAAGAGLPAPIQAEIAQIAAQAARATLQRVFQTAALFGGRVHHATTVASLQATSAAVLTDFATVLTNPNGLARQEASIGIPG